MRLQLIFAAIISMFLASAAAADPRPSGIEAPPAFTLRFTVATGNDDLRGGRDNVRALIYLHGRTITRQLNQRGMRWADNTTHVVNIALPAGTRFEDFESIELQTTFRGGVDGDNWNMNSVVVDLLYEHPLGNGQFVVARHGPNRFTGERRSIGMPFRPELGTGARMDIITK